MESLYVSLIQRGDHTCYKDNCFNNNNKPERGLCQSFFADEDLSVHRAEGLSSSTLSPNSEATRASASQRARRARCAASW